MDHMNKATAYQLRSVCKLKGINVCRLSKKLLIEKLKQYEKDYGVVIPASEFVDGTPFDVLAEPALNVHACPSTLSKRLHTPLLVKSSIVASMNSKKTARKRRAVCNYFPYIAFAMRRPVPQTVKTLDQKWKPLGSSGGEAGDEAAAVDVKKNMSIRELLDLPEDDTTRQRTEQTYPSASMSTLNKAALKFFTVDGIYFRYSSAEIERVHLDQFPSLPVGRGTKDELRACILNLKKHVINRRSTKAAICMTLEVDEIVTLFSGSTTLLEMLEDFYYAVFPNGKNNESYVTMAHELKTYYFLLANTLYKEGVSEPYDHDTILLRLLVGDDNEAVEIAKHFIEPSYYYHVVQRAHLNDFLCEMMGLTAIKQRIASVTVRRILHFSQKDEELLMNISYIETTFRKIEEELSLVIDNEGSVLTDKLFYGRLTPDAYDLTTFVAYMRRPFTPNHRRFDLPTYPDDLDKCVEEMDRILGGFLQNFSPEYLDFRYNIESAWAANSSEDLRKHAIVYKIPNWTSKTDDQLVQYLMETEVPTRGRLSSTLSGGDLLWPAPVGPNALRSSTPIPEHVVHHVSELDMQPIQYGEVGQPGGLSAAKYLTKHPVSATVSTQTMGATVNVSTQTTAPTNVVQLPPPTQTNIMQTQTKLSYPLRVPHIPSPRASPINDEQLHEIVGEASDHVRHSPLSPIHPVPRPQRQQPQAFVPAQPQQPAPAPTTTAAPFIAEDVLIDQGASSRPVFDGNANDFVPILQKNVHFQQQQSDDAAAEAAAAMTPPSQTSTPAAKRPRLVSEDSSSSSSSSESLPAFVMPSPIEPSRLPSQQPQETLALDETLLRTNLPTSSVEIEQITKILKELERAESQLSNLAAIERNIFQCIGLV